MTTFGKVWITTAMVLIVGSILIGSNVSSDPNGNLNPLGTWALGIGAVGVVLLILFGIGCAANVFTTVIRDVIDKEHEHDS